MKKFPLPLVIVFVLIWNISSCQSDLGSDTNATSEASTNEPLDLDYPPMVPGEPTRLMQQKWRLLTVPVQDETNLEDFLSRQDLQDSVLAIWSWDPTAQEGLGQWFTWPERSDYALLETFQPNQAYWFRVDTEIEFSGDGEINRNFNFGAGWNLFGFSNANSAISVGAFFEDGQSLSEVVSVWKWSGQNWSVWSPGQTIDEINAALGGTNYLELNALTPGNGYWVQFSNEAPDFEFVPSKVSSQDLMATFRTIMTPEYLAEREQSEMEEWAQHSGRFEEAAEDLMGFSDESQLINSVAMMIMNRFQLDENNDLVQISDLNNFPLVSGEQLYYLDLQYEWMPINQFKVTWAVKYTSGSNSTLAEGTFELNGSFNTDIKQKGSLVLHAQLPNFSISVPEFNYDFGVNVDELPANQEVEMSVEMHHASIYRTSNGTPFYAELDEVVLEYIYIRSESDVEYQNDEFFYTYFTSLFYDGNDTLESIVSQIKINGQIQAGDAYLHGEFLLLNETRSVFVNRFQLAYQQEDNRIVVIKREIPLFDSISFAGSIEDQVSETSLEGEFELVLSPEQPDVYYPDSYTIYGEFSDLIEPLEVQYNDSINVLNAFEFTSIPLESGVAIDVDYDYYPSFHLNVSTASSESIRGTVNFNLYSDSLDPTQSAGYAVAGSWGVLEEDRQQLDVMISLTDMDMSLSAVVSVNPQDASIETIESFTLGNDWVRLELYEGLEIDDTSTREVGKVYNTLDNPLGTVEYNQDLGFRIKYNDGEFETL